MITTVTQLFRMIRQSISILPWEHVKLSSLFQQTERNPFTATESSRILQATWNLTSSAPMYALRKLPAVSKL